MTRYSKFISLKYFIAWAGSALSVICFICHGDWLVAISPLVFLITFIVLGMPHGVIDALLLFGQADLGVRGKSVSRSSLITGYLSLSVLYLALWIIFPKIALTLFLGLTAFHWGTAEFGERGGHKSLWYQLGVSRGLIIISPAFAFHYEQTVKALTYFDYSLPQQPLLYLWAACILWHCVTLVVSYRRYKTNLFIPLLDLVFLLLLLVFTPVLVGIGIYYTLFHALRFYTWFVGDDRQVFTRKNLLLKTHSISLIAFLLILLSYGLIHSLNINVLEFSNELLPLHLITLAILTLPHSILAFMLQSGSCKLVKPSTIL